LPKNATVRKTYAKTFWVVTNKKALVFYLGFIELLVVDFLY
jgi:hypothetical protein